MLLPCVRQFCCSHCDDDDDNGYTNSFQSWYIQNGTLGSYDGEDFEELLGILQPQYANGRALESTDNAEIAEGEESYWLGGEPKLAKVVKDEDIPDGED